MTPQPTSRPFVSVIVPVFNDRAGILRCLEAIATQSYPLGRIEVLVVDNGSVPPLTIEPTYPFRLSVLRCLTPGSYAARNSGARSASGEILAFIDADCWPDHDWLERGVGRLILAQNGIAVGGEVTFVPPSRVTAVALYQLIGGFGQESRILERRFATTANLICRSYTYRHVGGFEERLLSGGDSEWSWRAQAAGVDLVFEPQSVVFTEPRTTLRGSIRQARRVAGGRLMLRRFKLGHLGATHIGRTRGLWQSIRWVLTHPELGIWDRFRVLGVAAVLRATSSIEAARLALGAAAERR